MSNNIFLMNRCLRNIQHRRVLRRACAIVRYTTFTQGVEAGYLMSKKLGFGWNPEKTKSQLRVLSMIGNSEFCRARFRVLKYLGHWGD
jgi:hypothetical protein